MGEQIYHDLQERINHYAIGFNKTESGIEMALLKKLFTPEHAALYLHLEHRLEPVSVIAERARMTEPDTLKRLELMSAKGLTFPITRNGIRYFAAAPYMHGIFENYALANSEVAGTSQEFKELSQLFERYKTGGFFPTGYAMRTIPVSEKIDPGHHRFIEPFENVKKIIRNKERIGLFPCSCHLHVIARGESCQQVSEVCLAFDFYAEYMIEGLGTGRWITKDEAMEVVKKSEEEGLVHQVGGDGNHVEAICNCCADCCGVLRVAKEFPVPGEVVLNNFYVQLDETACIQCEICIERCPMTAFSLKEDMIKLDRNRCIGCGLCTTTCSADALSLVSKPEEDRTGVFPEGTYTFMRPSVDFEADIT